MNYEEKCKAASKEQGIDPIVDALLDLGIKATSEQTGGFTICAYVELSGGKYIYANPYGAGVYDEDNYLADIGQYDEPMTPQTIAQAIKEYIEITRSKPRKGSRRNAPTDEIRLPKERIDYE
jgi:hypothetical protein